jgi:hypothetical protein
MGRRCDLEHRQERWRSRTSSRKLAGVHTPNPKIIVITITHQIRVTWTDGTLDEQDWCPGKLQQALNVKLVL